jgi:hypothetical protein
MSFVDGGGYELNSAIMTAERALVKSLRKGPKGGPPHRLMVIQQNNARRKLPVGPGGNAGDEGD